MKVRPGCSEVPPGDMKVRGRRGKSCPDNLELRDQPVKVRLRPGKSFPDNLEVQLRQVKVRPSNLEVRVGDLKSRDQLPEMGLACSATSQNHLTGKVAQENPCLLTRIHAAGKEFKHG